MKNKTLQICAEIGRDTSRGLARAGKSTAEGLAQIICKSSYPILGNLSGNLQTRIENLVGKGYYSSEEARTASILTNFAVYETALFIALKGKTFVDPTINTDSIFTPEAQQMNYNVNIKMLSAIGCFLYTYFETMARVGNKDQIIASLLGKIVSLPFDALTYAYDTGKNYLQDVKRRVERRRLDIDVQKR